MGVPLASFNPFTHAVEWMRFALYGKDPGIAPWVVLGTLVVCFVLACWGYDPQRGFGGADQARRRGMRRRRDAPSATAMACSAGARARTGAAALASAACRARAAGDAFPTRPITLWVPWPAGGATDLTLRLLAELAGAPRSARRC